MFNNIWYTFRQKKKDRVIERYTVIFNLGKYHIHKKKLSQSFTRKPTLAKL